MVETKQNMTNEYVLKTFKDIATLASLKKPAFGGILFSSDAAYVAHQKGHFVVKMHGEGFSQGFFRYESNKYERAVLIGECADGKEKQVTVDGIEKIFRGIRPDFKVRMPIYHVMKAIHDQYPKMEDRNHLRLILEVSDGNQMEGAEFPAVFKRENGEFVYYHPYLSKPCVLHRFRYNYHTHDPEKTQMIVRVTQDAGSHYVVEALKPFFCGCRIGMFETRTAYLEQYDRQLFLDEYEPEKIVYWAILEKGMNYGSFQKIVMRALYLFEILRLFRGCDFVDIYTHMDVLKPICIEGVRKSEGSPHIQAILMPLDPTIRGGE